MRRIAERASQQNGSRRIGLATVAALLLLAGCANQGIWPTEDLPPAPAQQLPFPSFQPRDAATDDERGILTEIEREDLEKSLAKAAESREKAVEQRIEKSGK